MKPGSRALPVTLSALYAATLLLLSAPAAAQATDKTPVPIQHHSGTGILQLEMEHQPPRFKYLDISENGDLVIRCSMATLTLAYSQPEEPRDTVERIRLIQRQDCPAINGISVRLSFAF